MTSSSCRRIAPPSRSGAETRRRPCPPPVILSPFLIRDPRKSASEPQYSDRAAEADISPDLPRRNGLTEQHPRTPSSDMSGTGPGCSGTGQRLRMLRGKLHSSLSHGLLRSSFKSHWRWFRALGSVTSGIRVEVHLLGLRVVRVESSCYDKYSPIVCY